MTMITRLEVDKKYANIEMPDLGYLYLVWDYVLKYYKPKASAADRKQDGFDHIVNATERMTGYYWPYKPEVSFSVPKGDATPVPHLTRDRKAGKKEQEQTDKFIETLGRDIGLTDPTTEGKNRRHTRWKASKPIIPGASVKRPDLIIVKDHKIRWPGRKAVYPPTGEEYDDNLKRLVEMKYGRDSLSQEQETTYKQIATKERFAVLKIWQDKNKGDKSHIYDFSPDFVPVFGFKPDELLPKIRLEPWVAKQNGKPVNILDSRLTDQESLAAAYHPETVAMLAEHAPWLNSLGEFERSTNGVRWVGNNGKVIKFNDEDLQQAADYLEQHEDIPRDYLPYVEDVSVVMSTENALMLAVKFVKDNQEEIIITLLTVAAVAVAASVLPGGLLGIGAFLLRMARYAPALGVSAKVWAADEQFEGSTNCYRYVYLVPKKPPGQKYSRNEYEITHYLPWRECGENSDTDHLEGWDEKVTEFDKRHRR